MFLLDKPYVSPFLKDTIKNNKLPLLENALVSELATMTSEQALAIIKEKQPPIYSNSENAIDWIDQNLSFTEIPAQINLFKDKYKFRQLTQKMYPDFFFKQVKITELNTIDINALPMPFIIKPSVGFFSMGVYKVNEKSQWQQTVEKIHAEMQQVKNLYPQSVMDAENFIIEQCINGEEYAVDAYVNAQGEAVVLSILKHTFASEDDVSDRVYTTSKAIIEQNLHEFTTFVQKIADLSHIKTFPLHIELRRETNGELLPIEVNPMRFGGWCTTADMSHFAYGFNQYLYYYHQQKPNWNELLKDKQDKLYSVIVLDNSTGKSSEEIYSFDYQKITKQFEKVLELRKINHKTYPLFGFLFVETHKDNIAELNTILESDLNEFVNQI